jgi:ribosomal subunit interface protein
LQNSLEITFIDCDRSEAVEARVRERVSRLERHFGRMTSCRVHVIAPHHHQRKGRLYEVRIDVRVPGSELAITGNPGDIYAHEDVYVAVRDAFDAMERQLEEWKRKTRGDVKLHEHSPQGRISEIRREDGYGRIETVGGELYFHRNAVVGADFESLREGDPVEFVAQTDESDQGPQASTVRPIGPLAYVERPA